MLRQLLQQAVRPVRREQPVRRKNPESLDHHHAPFTFHINAIIKPEAYNPATECAVAGSDPVAV